MANALFSSSAILLSLVSTQLPYGADSRSTVCCKNTNAHILILYQSLKSTCNLLQTEAVNVYSHVTGILIYSNILHSNPHNGVKELAVLFKCGILVDIHEQESTQPPMDNFSTHEPTSVWPWFKRRQCYCVPSSRNRIALNFKCEHTEFWRYSDNVLRSHTLCF